MVRVKKKMKKANQHKDNYHKKSKGRSNFIMAKKCTEMDDMMKKLNHDVQQFVAKQSTPQERREMERQRIIKLGAKPPKVYKNYKDLMDEKKQKKLIKIRDDKLKAEKDPHLLKFEKKKAQQELKNQPKKTDPFYHEQKKFSNFGMHGRCKNGVLKLSKKDLANMK